MKQIVAKYRALVALVLVALCALPGCHAQTVSSGVAAAIAEAKAKPHAPVIYPETSVARFGMVTGKAGKPILYRLDPKTGDVRFVDLSKFAATIDNPAGWTIDPTTGALTAPSGKVIAGVSFKQSPYAVSTTLISTKSGLAQTVDGQALNTAGMRVWQITVGSSDGCWVVASGAWTHCDEAAVGADMAGAFFAVGHGTSNKGLWIVTNAAAAGIVGTNTLAATNLSTLGGGGAVSSVFTRTGAVVAAAGDYTAAQVGALAGIDVATVTTAALPTYVAAGSGVGKTLTFSANAVCGTLGGHAMVLGDKVLVQNPTTPVDVGLYAETTAGDGATVGCVLTRDTAADQAAEIATIQVHVTDGSRRGAVYEYGGPSPITVDTTNLYFRRVDANRGLNEWSEFCEEFGGEGVLASSGTIILGTRWLQTQTNGTSIVAGLTSTTTEDGILSLATGALATTAASIAKQDSTGSALPSVFLATDQYFDVAMRFATNTVSDGTNTDRIQAGLGTVTNGIGSTDGLLVEHDIAQDATHWLMNTRASSVTTPQVAGLVVGGQQERFNIIHFPGESTCHMLQGGTEQGAISCSGVLGGAGLEPLMTIVKSAGTSSRNLQADQFCLRRGWPKGRG